MRYKIGPINRQEKGEEQAASSSPASLTHFLFQEEHDTTSYNTILDDPTCTHTTAVWRAGASLRARGAPVATSGAANRTIVSCKSECAVALSLLRAEPVAGALARKVETSDGRDRVVPSRTDGEDAASLQNEKMN